MLNLSEKSIEMDTVFSQNVCSFINTLSADILHWLPAESTVSE